ncbi:arabinogalactan peptide 20-like [Cucurbita pepo subsp. pepo]|uniref:arabinogalactan peptide 20-like n=1 Tax=Cucurbita pepo subsp. pepo TaxID=3664 RepID=UPI000C9D496F|nr:arabinogalactan peptide 20-like [Cucurbita pepo subsp. pepo]
MASSSDSTPTAFSGFFTCFALIFFILSPLVHAHSSASAPAPAPASDGTSIDQGIAYVLMLMALVLTYLIHPLDASSYQFFLN